MLSYVLCSSVFHLLISRATRRSKIALAFSQIRTYKRFGFLASSSETVLHLIPGDLRIHSRWRPQTRKGFHDGSGMGGRVLLMDANCPAAEFSL